MNHCIIRVSGHLSDETLNDGFAGLRIAREPVHTVLNGELPDSGAYGGIGLSRPVGVVLIEVIYAVTVHGREMRSV